MMVGRRTERVLAMLLLTVLLTVELSAGTLQGVVRGPDDAVIAGAQVLLYDYAIQRIEPEQAARRTVTDHAGRFRFEDVSMERALVEVRGEQGAGRVAVTLDEQTEPLHITYPVRTTIIILHNNDQHFNVHLADQVRETVEEYRRSHPNVFLMNAGDIFIRHRNRWAEDDEAFYAQRANLIIDTMNEAGYDVMTAGNHELHVHGLHTKRALERARFPILAANFQPHDRLPAFKPYLIVETDNRHTIAVLGLTTGHNTTDIDETVQQYLHLAEAHDVFMALTHIGIQRDTRLAESFGQFDLIIGGHSHTLINPERHVERHARQINADGAHLVNGVLVAQAGGIYGIHRIDESLLQYLGKVILTLENGCVIDKTNMVYVLEPQMALQLAE